MPVRKKRPCLKRCKRGHEFTPDNIYQPTTRKVRECLTCRKLRQTNKWRLGVHEEKPDDVRVQPIAVS